MVVCDHCNMTIQDNQSQRYCVINDVFYHGDCDQFKPKFVAKNVNL